MNPEIVAVADKVRSYITDNFLYMRAGYQLSDSESLFAGGIVDSLGVMELIAFAEQDFGVQVADDEITEQNFGSVMAIAQYVIAKPKVGARALSA